MELYSVYIFWDQGFVAVITPLICRVMIPGLCTQTS